MTRRRSRYRSLASLQRDCRACRACTEAGFPLESRPVLQGHAGQLAYLFGQAPGVVEGNERRPWRGRAGRTLRRWLELDEDEFYATFYCASVTRCYPGRSPGGRGDRAPTTTEQRLCSFWRDWELRLLEPHLVVPVGGLAIGHLLGRRPLGECVGRRFDHGQTVTIPLPHPSGASAWLNDRDNRGRVARAASLIRAELTTLATTTRAAARFRG
jgi:uracil-DNA glycosylase